MGDKKTALREKMVSEFVRNGKVSKKELQNYYTSFEPKSLEEQVELEVARKLWLFELLLNEYDDNTLNEFVDAFILYYHSKITPLKQTVSESVQVEESLPVFVVNNDDEEDVKTQLEDEPESKLEIPDPDEDKSKSPPENKEVKSKKKKSEPDDESKELKAEKIEFKQNTEKIDVKKKAKKEKENEEEEETEVENNYDIQEITLDAESDIDEMD